MYLPSRSFAAGTIVLVLTAVATSWAYWLAGIPHSGWRDVPRSNSILQSYTEGLARGHSTLTIEPDPRLLALPNPYDPEQNDGVRLGDASLYRGKYYCYFGLAPFLGLLVPWYKVTGTHLTPEAVTWMFCVIGMAAYNGALWRLWKKTFSSAGLWPLLIALVVATSGNAIWPLLTRCYIYSDFSAAGFAAFALTVFCATMAETSGIRARRSWRTATMLACGLVMGCRPNYFPAVIILAGWVFWRTWREGHHAKRRGWVFLGLMSPLVVSGLLLATWNVIRFQNPLEFGFRYQLVTLDRADSGYLGISHAIFNLHRYILALPRLGSYFPFIEGELPGPVALPAAHESTNWAFGFIWLSPVALFAVSWFGLRPTEHRELRWIAAITSFSSLGILVLLSCIGTTTYRYLCDFLAPLAFAAALAVVGCGNLSTRWLRRGLLSMAGALAVLTGAIQTCWAVSIFGDFSAGRPGDFTVLAQPFNALVYAQQSWRGDGPRGLALTVRFPSNRVGSAEPLVVTGPQSAQDFLYVVYVTSGTLRLGFESIGHGGPVSRLLELDYKQPHHIRLDYGNFLPPDDHPLLRGLLPTEKQLAKRSLTVWLDGQPVLDAWAEFHPVLGRVFLGASPLNPAFGQTFTGQILQVEHPLLRPVQDSAPRWPKSGYGPIHLDLTLQTLPVGSMEPLLMVGHHNQGEALLLRSCEKGQWQVGWHSQAGVEQWGPSFEGKDHRTKTVRVQWGALLPPAGSHYWLGVPPSVVNEEKSLLDVEIDGKSVLELHLTPFDASPTTVKYGENSLELSGVAPQIAGALQAVGRSEWH
jgi:hypothetical protein